MDRENQTSDVQSRVRSYAGSAAIAAVLMLYFGFAYLQEPTGTDLFSRSQGGFYHTLRIGGIAMAVLALWFWTGHSAALVLDVLISAIIGAIFAMTGLGMGMDGGGMLQSLLIIIFGWMFISAGVHHWKTYKQMKASSETRDSLLLSTPVTGVQLDQGKTPVTTADQSPAGRFTERIENEPAVAATRAQNVEPSDAYHKKTEDDTNPVEPSSTESSPEGFLASFADKEAPPRE